MNEINLNIYHKNLNVKTLYCLERINVIKKINLPTELINIILNYLYTPQDEDINYFDIYNDLPEFNVDDISEDIYNDIYIYYTQIIEEKQGRYNENDDYSSEECIDIITNVTSFWSHKNIFLIQGNLQNYASIRYEDDDENLNRSFYELCDVVCFNEEDEDIDVNIDVDMKFFPYKIIEKLKSIIIPGSTYYKDIILYHKSIHNEYIIRLSNTNTNGISSNTSGISLWDILLAYNNIYLKFYENKKLYPMFDIACEDETELLINIQFGSHNSNKSKK
jgi:hypothetical protein